MKGYVMDKKIVIAVAAVAAGIALIKIQERAEQRKQEAERKKRMAIVDEAFEILKKEMRALEELQKRRKDDIEFWNIIKHNQ